MPKQQVKAKPAMKQRQKSQTVARRKIRPKAHTPCDPITFTIYGPFATPIQRKGKGAIRFSSENPAEIFAQREAKEHADKRGCYVLANKCHNAYTPFYVGQTTRSSFALEVFASHKQNKCRDAAMDFPTGKMVFFLLIPKTNRQFKLSEAIRLLEKELVAKAIKVNPKLKNDRLVPRQAFRIEGIHDATPGQPRKEVQQFRKMMGYTAKAKTARKV